MLGRGYIYSFAIHFTLIAAIVFGQIQIPLSKSKTVDLTLLNIEQKSSPPAKSTFKLPEKISKPKIQKVSQPKKIEKKPEPKIAKPPDIDETAFRKPDPGEKIEPVEPLAPAPVEENTAAAGEGNGSVSGMNGAGSSEGYSDPEYRSPKEYFKVVKNRIESKKSYPESAKLRRMEGIIKARFIIQMNGMADSVEIAKSSGCSELDDAALRAIKSAAPFPELPRNLFKDKLNIELAVVFELK